MLGRAFSTLAAVALGANAFLLPPGTDSLHSDSVSTFLNPNTQSIKLTCPDCVFKKPNDDVGETEADDLFWVQGRDRAIVLNFTVTDDAKAININGWQIYPVTMENPTEPSVAEVAATASFADIQDHPEVATTLDVSAAGIFVNEETVSPMGDKIINVNYQVISLQGQPITVDGAAVKLLQTADGNLMIISVEGLARTHSILDPNTLPVPSPSSPEKECGMLPAALCKWKSMVEAKIGGFKQGLPSKTGRKGCGGNRPHKLPGHIRPHIEYFEESESEARPKHHHGGPPHPHPHPPHGMHGGPHHHGHHGHRFLHGFIMALVSILVPVLAGITMGMFVSVLGVAVGRLIVFMWIKLRRGGQRGYASVAQTEAETESMEKGAVVVVKEDEEEPLPQYEAAPAYDDHEQK